MKRLTIQQADSTPVLFRWPFSRSDARHSCLTKSSEARHSGSRIHFKGQQWSPLSTICSLLQSQYNFSAHTWQSRSRARRPCWKICEQSPCRNRSKNKSLSKRNSFRRKKELYRSKGQDRKPQKLEVQQRVKSNWSHDSTVASQWIVIPNDPWYSCSGCSCRQHVGEHLTCVHMPPYVFIWIFKLTFSVSSVKASSPSASGCMHVLFCEICDLVLFSLDMNCEKW